MINFRNSLFRMILQITHNMTKKLYIKRKILFTIKQQVFEEMNNLDKALQLIEFGELSPYSSNFMKEESPSPSSSPLLSPSYFKMKEMMRGMMGETMKEMMKEMMGQTMKEMMKEMMGQTMKEMMKDVMREIIGMKEMMKESIKQVKQEINEMKQEINEIKEEISQMKIKKQQIQRQRRTYIKVSLEVKQQIIRDYLEGFKIKRIASKFDLKITSIKHIIRQYKKKQKSERIVMM